MPDRSDSVLPIPPDPGGNAFDLLRAQVEAQAAQLGVRAGRLEALERDHAATALRLETTAGWIQGGLCQHLTNVMLAAAMLRRRLGDDAEHVGLVDRLERFARLALADTRALVAALVG